MIKAYKGLNETSPLSVLVCHGSMQMKFDQFHPLVQYYQKKFNTVYSIELPGHGSQRDYEDVSSFSPQDVIEILYKEIDSTCPTEHLLITSYSISAMLFIKMWKRLCNRNKDLKGIFIGTAITIKPETKSLITGFFSEEMYLRLGWENIMIRQHGPNWKKTIKMINNWFNGNLQILPTPEETNFLIKQEQAQNIFFILGKKDQPFKKDDILSVYNFTLYEVEGDHFGYFVIKRSWPEVEKILDTKLDEWFHSN